MATLSLPLRRIKKLSSNTKHINQWNSQIRESVNRNKPEEALSLFHQMKRSSTNPNHLTFPFVSKACAQLSITKYAQIIHAHIVKSAYCEDVYVQTALLDSYVKCGRLELACKVFDEMPVRDVTAWNAMLVGFSQEGSCERVLGFFREMRFAGVLPDSVSVMGVSRGVACGESLVLAKSIHCLGIQIGVDWDVSVANTWISMYAKTGDLGFAELVFRGIGRSLRSMVSWNSMISGYANFEHSFGALKCFKQMLCDGFCPDTSSIVSLLSSFVELGVLLQGMMVHCYGIRVGCDQDICVSNTLISTYCKCGEVGSARFLFDNMCERSSVSWTAMISGYAELGDLNEVLALFNAMQPLFEKPDLVSVLAVISGCAQSGILEVGRWIDEYADSHRLKDNIVICNALIDMYAKCGAMCDAQELFYAMPERTVVSWTTMISGCALNGFFGEALNLFHQMLDLGLKPNNITFLAVLQACCHAGLLDEAQNFFHLMTKVYKICPSLDHYSCMADLLGRRGKIKDAFELIQDMPIKPDVAIWSALLSACKIHQNTEIGEYAANHLFEMEPHVAVPYVEMANLYASVGRWDGVAKIRKMMKFNKVKKSPGKSIIEVNGKTHIFTVEDRGYSEGELSFALLDRLMLQAKENLTLFIYDRTHKHNLESVVALNTWRT